MAGFDESQDRDVLKFNMNLHLMDKMGVAIKQEFTFTMELTVFIADLLASS